MDLYHIWCDLKPGIGDLEFAEKVTAYMGHLKQQGMIESPGGWHAVSSVWLRPALASSTS